MRRFRWLPVAFLLVAGCDYSIGLGLDRPDPDTAPVLSLRLGPSQPDGSALLRVGEMGIARVTVNRGTDVSPATGATLESSDPAVVSVAPLNGELAEFRARAAGTAWITARWQGASAQRKVVVR